MLISVETKESSYDVTIPDSAISNLLNPKEQVIDPVLQAAHEYIFAKEKLNVREAPSERSKTIEELILDTAPAAAVPEPKIMLCTHNDDDPDAYSKSHRITQLKEVYIVFKWKDDNYDITSVPVYHNSLIVYDNGTETGIEVVKMYKNHTVADNSMRIIKWFDDWPEAADERDRLSEMLAQKH